MESIGRVPNRVIFFGWRRFCVLVRAVWYSHDVNKKGVGPVAQLGARFHGMEEVKGSNPFRSTKTFQTVTVDSPLSHRAVGLQPESSSHLERNVFYPPHESSRMGPPAIQRLRILKILRRLRILRWKIWIGYWRDMWSFKNATSHMAKICNRSKGSRNIEGDIFSTDAVYVSFLFWNTG